MMTELNNALEQGLRVISNNQTVDFTLYNRVVLPLDGFVFFVKTSTVVTVSGDLHYSSSQDMDESDTTTSNTVLFTTSYQVTDLNAIGGNQLWIGIIDGVKFSFNTTGLHQKNAGLWHYTGESIKATWANQFIDDPLLFDSKSIVDSASIAAWLELSTPALPIYPSHLVPANQKPPYIAINITEQSTHHNAPYRDGRNGSS
jgi:hypothetical protein